MTTATPNPHAQPLANPSGAILSDAPTPTAVMRSSPWPKLIALVVVGIGVFFGLRALGVDFSRLDAQHIKQFVLSFGPWAPIIYILAYGQPIVPLPASLMTGLAGVTFGRGPGTLFAMIGATLRACTEFAIARLLGRDAVAKLLKGKVASLDQKIGQNSFKAVLLIRMIPNLPFDMQNYGLGFSQVRFAPYMIATFLGIIPGSFAYVYLGESLTDPKNLWKLGLAILLIVALMFGQKLLKAKQSSSSPGDPESPK